MKLSRREQDQIKEGDAPQLNSSMPHSTSASGSQKIHKKHVILGVAGILIIGIIVYSISVYSSPGLYDDFAKCLSEKGAVMYGAMGWCKYTQAQKAMFGRSFKYINYHEFTELPGIKKTPTWVISGKWHENTQSFDKLAELTGC